MKDTTKYKLLATFILLFIAIISLSMGFFVASSRTSGNIAYWVFKVIAIAWLVVEVVLLWTVNKSFGNNMVTGIFGFLVQFIPILLRIGWCEEKGFKVPTWAIYVAAILVFIFLVLTVFFAISSIAFKKAEDKAKPSSKI